MKKIDKLVFGSFIGPFILTLIVVDFILLLVTLIRYFDELFGKGLSLDIFAKLLGYFSISSSPDAFPLAVLLSSIMTFGNLGEHSELTAIKSSGISLVRALLPIFGFVLILTGVTYYTNTQLVPKTNLKTYSLLWDMRTKKPALDIKEGVFYDGIPGYSIKVNEKVTDEHLKDIIIYDHTGDNTQSNKKAILADSGRMYSFMNQRYLALELFDGIRYEETIKQNYFDKRDGGQFVRDRFKTSKMVFDLSSFDMGSTDEKLFRRSRLVQTRADLKVGIDSMSRDIYNKQSQMFRQVSNTFTYHMLGDAETPQQIEQGKQYYDSIRDLRVSEAQARKEAELLAEKSQLAEGELNEPDSVLNDKEEVKPVYTQRAKPVPLPVGDDRKEASELLKKKFRSIDPELNLERFDTYYALDGPGSNNIRLNAAISYGVNQSRTLRNLISTREKTLQTVRRDQRKFMVTRNQQLSRSFACLVMFLIGAPLGAIIKKGGLGMPVIVSVIFFLIYYILNTTGDKWGKEDVMDPVLAVWISNAALLPAGLFFLRQARNDARLFESDFYMSFLLKIKNLFTRKKANNPA